MQRVFVYQNNENIIHCLWVTKRGICLSFSLSFFRLLYYDS
jgi:hypothetical protein